MTKLPRLFGPVAFYVLLLFSATGCSKLRTSRHLSRAATYYAAGQYPSAELEYLNVLRLQPDNPVAVGRLGMIYLQQGRAERAYSLLVKARDLGPENLEVRMNLALYDLGAGQVKEAWTEVNFVLDHDPLFEHAARVLAETARSPQQFEEAHQRLERIPPPGNRSESVLVGLGTLALRQNHLADAEARFKEAQAVEPKSSEAAAALGNLALLQHNQVEAEQEFLLAAKLAPPRSTLLMLYPNLELRTGHLEEARHALERVIQATPDFVPAMLMSAQIAGMQKRYGDSETLVNRILAFDPTSYDGLVLQARLKMEKKNYAEAIKILENTQNLFPKLPEVRFRLAQSYIADGDIEKGTATLSQALAIAPAYSEAELLWAEIQIRKGDRGSAIAILKRAVQQRPDFRQGQLLLAECYRSQGDPDSALAVYGTLAKANPKDPYLWLNLGIILEQQSRPGEARTQFEQAIQVSPDYLPAVDQLVQLDLAEKKFVAARSRVDAEIAKFPKLAGPRILLAELNLRQSKIADGEAALKMAIQLQPDAIGAYQVLARLYIQQNQQLKALADLQAEALIRPRDVGTLMEIGMIQQLQKNYTQAREAYEQILTINPKFAPALNNLAYLYSENFNLLDQAYDTATKASIAAPQEPHAADTLGWILYKKHQYARSLSVLQPVAANLPLEAEVQFHLGMAHYMMGQEAAAAAALRRALQLNSDFSGASTARERLAVLAIKAGQPGSDAQAELERIVAARPDDPIALARLGLIYSQAGDSKKAIATYQRALRENASNTTVMAGLAKLYGDQGQTAQAADLAKAARELAPDDPQIAHTLGVLAFRTRDFPWAASLLRDALRMQPDDPDTLYDAACAMYAIGRVSDALEAAERAAQTNAKFPRIAEAKQFVALVALEDDPVQAWENRAFVDRTLGADTASVPALMASGAIHRKMADTAGAQKIYEQVLTIYPDFRPALKQIVIIMARTPGHDDMVSELASKARDPSSYDPELGKALGMVAYRRGNYSLAAAQLDQSSKQLPNDAEALFYLGMANFRSHRVAAAKDALHQALELHLDDGLAAEARRTLIDLK
jgi:tetratricopeptide (TPR) repeat protein